MVKLPNNLQALRDASSRERRYADMCVDPAHKQKHLDRAKGYEREFERKCQATHVLYVTKDPEAPDAIRDANGEVVLGQCKACGRAEAQLEEAPCSGKRQ